MTWTLQSKAFKSSQRIPAQHTADGQDLSPALAWTEVPTDCEELALIVDDPDAPSSEPWVHWLLYKISPTTRELVEGIPPTRSVPSPPGALQGKNSWDTIGYRGPAPPRGHGIHHYHFKLYALDAALPLPPGIDKRDLLEAMHGHIVAEAELVGTYER